MRSFCSLPFLLAILLCGAFGHLRAEEQTSTYRIIGLCWPDREDDLRRVMTEVPELQLANVDYDKAEVTFRYDQASFFPDGKVPKNFTADKLFERIANAINGKSKGTFVVTQPSTVPVDQLTRVDIKVGILDCTGCRYGVYTTVSKMDGVIRATIGGQPSVLSAWIDPDKTSREALEAALKKARVDLPGSGS
jgi:hypothetical protein